MKITRSILGTLGVMAFTLSSPLEEKNSTRSVMYGLTHGDQKAHEEVSRDLSLLWKQGYQIRYYIRYNTNSNI